VLFLLHKNYLMVVPLFLFAFFSKYSGAFIYDQINSQFYSVVYTSLPIILLTIFDY
jgi:magnesium-transporting ATPase (P-type)